MRTRSFEDAMAEMYREQPSFAVDLIDSLLEDGERVELLIGLRQMVKAIGTLDVAAQAMSMPVDELRQLTENEVSPSRIGLTNALRSARLYFAVGCNLSASKAAAEASSRVA